MNKVDFTQASGVKGQPLLSTSMNFIQEGYREAIGQVLNLLCDAQYTGYLNAYGRVLSGLTLSGSVIANGYLAYVRNGYWEVMFVTGADTSAYIGVATLVNDDIYDPTLDPIVFSDSTTGSVHTIRRMKVQDSNVGAGLVNYSDLVFPNEFLVNTKVINIGDWNMDSTATLSVAHGLNSNRIRSVDVWIREDTGSAVAPLTYNPAGTPAGYFSYDGTNIIMSRLSAGLFDSTTYDSTSYNRGFIVIKHSY